MRLRPELRPGPRLAAYSALPYFLSELKRGVEKEGGKGRGREGKEKEGHQCPLQDKFLAPPMLVQDVYSSWVYKRNRKITISM